MNKVRKLLGGRLLPTSLGVLVYLCIFLLATVFDLEEWHSQMILVFSLGLGGFVSGKISGPDGIIGVIVLFIVMLGLFVLNQVFQPDALFLIGVFVLIFLQGVFSAGWLIGSIFHKNQKSI